MYGLLREMRAMRQQTQRGIVQMSTHMHLMRGDISTGLNRLRNILEALVEQQCSSPPISLLPTRSPSPVQPPVQSPAPQQQPSAPQQQPPAPQQQPPEGLRRNTHHASSQPSASSAFSSRGRSQRGSKKARRNFDELLDLMSPTLQRQDTFMRESIAPVERLLITLRYLATGQSLVSLHYAFMIGQSTASNIIRETCCALWDILHDVVMKKPNKEEWMAIADVFAKTCNFQFSISIIKNMFLLSCLRYPMQITASRT
uniref:Uncharacterized protein n=1 Tax=Leptobrachium leishanense TaxID=445787 RepID=A0A8C5QFW8_9ANUR